MNKFVKFISMMFVLIWFSGTVIMSVKLFYDHTRECVKNEGWFLGIFWCDDQISEGYIFIRASIWPTYLFRNHNNSGNKIDKHYLVNGISNIPSEARILFVSSVVASTPIRSKIAGCLNYSFRPETSERLSSIVWSAKFESKIYTEQCRVQALAAWNVISDVFPSSQNQVPEGPQVKYGNGPLFLPKSVFKQTKGFLNSGGIECLRNSSDGKIESFNVELIFEKNEMQSERNLQLISESNIFTNAMRDQGVTICN